MVKQLQLASLLLISVVCAACANKVSSDLPAMAFTELNVPFHHVWNQDLGNSHPFLGAAAIDVDGDGKKEIFVGGGSGQQDMLLSYRSGELIDVIKGTGLSDLDATYGSASIDFDNDGDIDLVVARNNSLSIYINNQGHFLRQDIALSLAPNSVPLSVALGDIDGDKDVDIYINAFVEFESFRSAVYNDAEHGKANILLRNDGNFKFTDITQSVGVASQHNTFTSAFIDLNGDHLQDLVLAQNTGQVEMFENQGDGVFTPIEFTSGYGFWMGLAAGDIDNDGDQDLLFSNIGGSIPDWLTKGDILPSQPRNTEWLLLRNDGAFNFVDVTAAYQLTNLGFGWGSVFEDINLDGKLDVMAAQNYIKWPIHKLFKLPGVVRLGTAEADQQESEAGLVAPHSAALENPYFGLSPLIADLNGDGRQDFLWINIDGPMRAFLNTSDNHFVTVALPNKASSLGATVSVSLPQGDLYHRQVIAGLGLLTEQTHELSFGLGENDQIDRIEVKYADGRHKVINKPNIDQRIYIPDEP